MKQIVMLADGVHRSERLNHLYPGRLGMLFGPGFLRDPRGLPYALDNGRFAVWSKKQEWDPSDFTNHLRKAAKLAYKPRFVVVPDVVANPDRTFAWWEQWAPWIKERYDWPLAMAVQDGMGPDDVLIQSPQPDVIFVGGTTEWKWRYLKRWCNAFKRVHCGRVNSYRLLWMADRSGVESSDGTGWFRGDQVQLAGLYRYLDRSQRGLQERNIKRMF